jgi:multidrug transporter EmrE-like cation transporter
VFFVLNLVFNAIMWTLFTAALSRGNSATTVSVINTTSNFLAAAMFGFYFFGEALPGSWWIGAGILITGSVVISRRDVMKKKEEGYTKLGEGEDGMERGRQGDDDDEDDEDGGVGLSSSREPSADSADVQNVKLRRT